MAGRHLGPKQAEPLQARRAAYAQAYGGSGYGANHALQEPCSTDSAVTYLLQPTICFILSTEIQRLRRGAPFAGSLAQKSPGCVLSKPPAPWLLDTGGTLPRRFAVSDTPVAPPLSPASIHPAARPHGRFAGSATCRALNRLPCRLATCCEAPSFPLIARSA